MNKIIQGKSKMIVTLFLCQVFMNWLYVAWVQSHIFTSAHAWLAILPLFGYFYIVFTILASIELLHKTRLGLGLAYSVIMFGIVCAVISYSMVYKQDYVFGWVITPLIAVNFAVVFYLALNQTYFDSD
ncbi:hypothetical protein AQUSIP_08890 [Aquicella siphonis]|uniref:Uncharacterized protein n=1 Tax=Aquicella siphonis TaxID=254247 RepID=A0A5E4PF36_9COXI|nr:hypothetical protein [Aquicella siphonis]VVC75599.1 hypothetical protein AQUSIP_08890 [Aquicella siphonis]